MNERKVSVTKLQGAERQLAEAIELYFEQRDPVAIHTLAAAAHQVIYDLSRQKGMSASLLKDCLYIKPEHRKEWSRAVAEAENFFKHANRDPAATLDFKPDTTTYFIVDALEMYGRLTGGVLPVGRVFMLHFVQEHPDFIEPSKAQAILTELQRMKLPKGDFRLSLQSVRLIRKFGSVEAAMDYLKDDRNFPRTR